MDQQCQEKWDRASRSYDWMTWADAHRFGAAKRRVFADLHGHCLMVAAGTGHDFAFFPPGLSLTAIDISAGMIEAARPRAAAYPGQIDLRVMDVQALEIEDASFDAIATSCTFCSVPDPVRGLRELLRCLRPGGRLLMFEHVRSRFGPVAVMQDLMTVISRRLGPSMNRDTGANVLRAGFELEREENVYFDIVKAFYARRPA